MARTSNPVSSTWILGDPRKAFSPLYVSTLTTCMEQNAVIHTKKAPAASPSSAILTSHLGALCHVPSLSLGISRPTWSSGSSGISSCRTLRFDGCIVRLPEAQAGPVQEGWPPWTTDSQGSCPQPGRVSSPSLTHTFPSALHHTPSLSRCFLVPSISLGPPTSRLVLHGILKEDGACATVTVPEVRLSKQDRDLLTASAAPVGFPRASCPSPEGGGPISNQTPSCQSPADFISLK